MCKSGEKSKENPVDITLESEDDDCKCITNHASTIFASSSREIFQFGQIKSIMLIHSVHLFMLCFTLGTKKILPALKHFINFQL